MNIEAMFNFGKEYTNDGILITVILGIIFFLITRFSIKFIQKMMNKHLKTKDKSTATTYNFIFKIFKVALYGFCLYAILIQFTALKSIGNILLGASSVAAMAFALAAQESMSNIVGGFFLAFFQPFKVGDLIKLTDRNIGGRVKDIGLRHTTITTIENSDIIIPNGIMNSCVIENRDTTVNYCNYLVFNISYDSDVDKAMAIIQKCAIQHKDCVDKKLCKVVVINLGDYSVDLRLAVNSVDAIVGFNLLCDLRKSVKKAFDENGIDIPFPVYTIMKQKNQDL